MGELVETRCLAPGTVGFGERQHRPKAATFETRGQVRPATVIHRQARAGPCEHIGQRDELVASDLLLCNHAPLCHRIQHQLIPVPGHSELIERPLRRRGAVHRLISP
ncbi:MAG: hypothetical protein HWE39_08990 [Oceanospirillaceae bacterium]|nr:hypothetical protein [Oceanospirillaceae bacterium]